MCPSLLILAAVLPLAAEMPPAKPLEAERLVVQLGSKLFREREAATKNLEGMGEAALEAVRRATTSSDLEVRRRAERVVRAIEARIHAEEARKLKGRWRAVEMEENGQKVSARDFLWELRFEDNVVHWRQSRSWQWRAANGSAVVRTQASTDHGPYLVRRLKEKKWMDIEYVENNHAKSMPGIFTLEQETLRLSLNLSGSQRPEKLESRPGTPWVILVFKRESR